MAHLRTERPLPRELAKEEQDGPLTPARAWKSWKIPTTTRSRAYRRYQWPGKMMTTTIKTMSLARERSTAPPKPTLQTSALWSSDAACAVPRSSPRNGRLNSPIPTCADASHRLPSWKRCPTTSQSRTKSSGSLIGTPKNVTHANPHGPRARRLDHDRQVDSVCRRGSNVRLGLFITPVSSARQDANHAWLGLVFVDKAGVKHVGVWDGTHVQKLHDYGMTTENTASTKILCTTASRWLSLVKGKDGKGLGKVCVGGGNEFEFLRGVAGGQCLELCRWYILKIAKTVRDNEGCFCLDPESKWVRGDHAVHVNGAT